ncbi:HD-GYP domain-containing protein [Paenibacillus thalictri]|nr:HD-GYP domain-containing protein [Paenibacillus thalictri]
MFNQTGVLVAAAGTVLNHSELEKLQFHGIELREDDVEAAGSFAGKMMEQSELINQGVRKISPIFEEMRMTKQVPLLEIRQNILPIIHQTTEQPNLFGLFASLQSKDDYTYRHNIGVGVIATLIGRWLGLTEAELSQLTMAATLHDIGKVKIPLEILNKPGKYTEEEFSMMKRHAVYGYQILKETVGINHRQALVALQHHERQDGSGYPLGIGGNKIDFFSRIVAVADIFHAMTSKRVYRDASPFYETLKQMENNAFGVLDPRIVRLFLDKVMGMLVGNEVLLTNGKNGTIVMVHPQDPMHPLVHIDGTFLDLRSEPGVHIQQVVI